eukprot:Colp12_sorted_trinity150504_noHs@16275
MSNLGTIGLSGWQKTNDEVINFAVGQPQAELFPQDLLMNAAYHRFMQCRAGTYDVRCMFQYAENRGDESYRDSLAQFLTKEYGAAVDKESLFVTNGSSLGLELCIRCFTKPGDTILVEDPTYFLVFQVFKDAGLNIVEVPTDEGGLIVEQLEDIIVQHKPAMLYCIPSFGNPTGAVLSHQRRVALADICDRHNVMAVSDDVYQILHFGTVPPLPLCFYMRNAVSLGSFSKLLCPGLRLGWIQSSTSILERLSACGWVMSSGGLNPFTGAIVQSSMEDDTLVKWLAVLREIYRKRAESLAGALRKEIPECQFLMPTGGYFLWVCLPVSSSCDLVAEAACHGVAFASGATCRASGRTSGHVRLCFAHYPSEELVEGVRRLAVALRCHKAGGCQ